jgi:hypothetical protein
VTVAVNVWMHRHMIEKNDLQAENKISIQSIEPKENRKGVRCNLCGNGDLRCLHGIMLGEVNLQLVRLASI